MIDLRKPLHMKIREHVYERSRRGNHIDYLTHQIIFGKLTVDYVKANLKPILMEWWEYEERARMEIEFPDAIYKIGSGDFIAHTGKGGYIEFLIGMKKICIKPPDDVNFDEGLISKLRKSKSYKPLTPELLGEILKSY